MISNHKSILIEHDDVQIGENLYHNIQMRDFLESLADRVSPKPASLQTYRRYTEGRMLSDSTAPLFDEVQNFDGSFIAGIFFAD